jgi:hypothetical protein
MALLAQNLKIGAMILGKGLYESVLIGVVLRLHMMRFDVLSRAALFAVSNYFV